MPRCLGRKASRVDVARGPGKGARTAPLGSGVHFPFTRPQRARRLGPVLAWKRPRHSATASARRFRNRCFEHCMTNTIPAAAGSPGDPLASAQHAISGAVPVQAARRLGPESFGCWSRQCLFVCQDSTARILLKVYPAMEIALARYFVHMVLVSALSSLGATRVS